MCIRDRAYYSGFTGNDAPSEATVVGLCLVEMEKDGTRMAPGVDSHGTIYFHIVTVSVVA